MSDEAIRLRFFFDAGVCVWSGNDAARSQFGYPIDPARLPITEELAGTLANLAAEHCTSLDMHDPAGPSPWSAERCADFKARSDRALMRLRVELSADYVIEDER